MNICYTEKKIKVAVLTVQKGTLTCRFNQAGIVSLP